MELTLNDTCITPKKNSNSKGIAYSTFVMKPNSGTYLATFEVKKIPDGRNSSMFAFIGIALATKIQNLDKKFLSKWG